MIQNYMKLRKKKKKKKKKKENRCIIYDVDPFLEYCKNQHL